MAAYVVKKRMEGLNVTKLFGISFDETTDVGRTGVIMFFIIYLDLTFNLVTDYLAGCNGRGMLLERHCLILFSWRRMEKFLVEVISYVKSVHRFCHQFVNIYSLFYYVSQAQFGCVFVFTKTD
jgi:hypothetical protein